MSEEFNLAMMGNSRVFIAEGRGRPDHEPTYMGCMRAGAAAQSFGDVTRVECPSPDEYNQYDVVTEVQGSEEPPTLSLVGRYAIDVTSTLLRLAKRRCASDVHVHFGACDDPEDFDTFSKSLVVEWARLPTWATEDLGALTSGDNNPVDENTDVSGRLLYEVVQLSVAEKGAIVIVNPLEDVIIASKRECGDCDDEDDGCQHIFATGDAQPGSEGSAPEVIWSVNGGQTLYADDISSLDASEDADALARLNQRIIVVSNDDGGYHYKNISDIIAGTPWLWTRVALDTNGPPNDIWSVGLYSFIVGDGGYIYGLSNPVAGAVTLDAGLAVTDILHAVHALSKKFAVAVGASGAIVLTTDGQNFEVVAPPVGIADTFNCVWLKSKKVWLIGSNAGGVFYTVDGGGSWVQLTNLPVTFTDVQDIAFSTNNVGYIAGLVGGVGVILRTYNGGNSWVALPEGVTNLPTNTGINAVAACKYDPNFVVGVGISTDDGIFVVGQE